ncbi:uncharacterized protein LOC141892448 isoform X4 [Acropora palmata]|uniref:uncharacterized protein LOC141892448 isoform X4 n=1 Tax=Acropora palmata TaxID=6131 RepID=UPI003DA0D441
MLTKNLRREIKGGTKGGRRSHEDVNAGLNREERLLQMNSTQSITTVNNSTYAYEKIRREIKGGPKGRRS